MKIGILTFHRPINYGAFLQSYSLSNRLANDFPEIKIEIIDYIAPKEKNKIYLNSLRALKYNGLSAFLKELFKIRRFKKALKYLPLSNESFCTNNLEELFKFIDKNYDILIIGSDAVFNWNQNGFPTAFIPNYDFKNCKVLTYAASVHGLKYYDENKEKIEYCKNSFSKMRFIGVRDTNTEKFVNFCNASSEPIHCCDPTVFLNYNALYKIPHRDLKILSEQYKFDFFFPYIVLMLEDEEISKKIKNKYGGIFKIVSLFKPNKFADIFLYDLSPVEWALVLKNSKLVFTNYFHGTLISLTQNTPVFAIDLSGYSDPYEGKMPDLMSRLGLTEYFVNGYEWESREKIVFSLADKLLKNRDETNFGKVLNYERKTYEKFNEILKNDLDLKRISR